MALRKAVRWEEMFPDQLDDALRHRPLVYLTYGLCEPHGLYSAVGLDALKAHCLACEAAGSHGGIVAPPFFWHIHEIGLEAPWADRTIGDRNPWLTSLPPWVFYKCVWFQLRAVADLGFAAAIVLTGHNPYERDLRKLAEMFMRHSPLRIWAGSVEDTCGGGVDSDGHAGSQETSLLWALLPALVDMSRLEEGVPAEGVMAGHEGARRASRREGEELAARIAGWLGKKGDDLLEASAAPRARRSEGGALSERMTFDDAERAWRADVEPLLGQFVSFEDPARYGLVREGSPWIVNQRSSLYP
jgi:creatinine amidohydrolase